MTSDPERALAQATARGRASDRGGEITDIESELDRQSLDVPGISHETPQADFRQLAPPSFSNVQSLNSYFSEVSELSREVGRVINFVTVRYIVNNIDEAIEFYTGVLDFKLKLHPAPEFAIMIRDNLQLLLSQPSGKAGGGDTMPDGTIQAPGGWNRFEIVVEDLDAEVQSLIQAGCHFRNDIVNGVGGRQILLMDPSGNLVELFEYYVSPQADL